MSTELLAAEYRELRRVKGHFSDPPAAWNPVADQWNGRKHQVMRELGERLEEGQHSKEDILKLLGEPDEVAAPDSELYPSLQSETGEPASEFLIYYWRGRHDYLFIACRGSMVTKVAWYMAYE